MKFVALLVALIASLATLSAAESIDFTSCAQYPFVEINAIEVSPKIPTQKGETATIDVTANVRNGNLEGGRIKVIVKAGGFPVVNIEKQICDFIRCPLKEGVQTISRNFTLPITLPHGEYEVHVAGTSADGRQIACIDATLPIKADAPSLATAPVGIRKIVFDAREQWPSLIEATLDQGKCAGSYAVATISSIEDRIAVADIERARALGVSDDALAAVGPSFRRSSKLSALDVIVNSPYNEQCRGGNATNAFAYIMGEGVASRACLPYGVWDSPPGPVRRCGFDEAPCIAPRPGPDTKPHSCLNGGDYEASKSLISSPVKFYNDVRDMQDAIRTAGPLVVTIAAHNSLINIGDKLYKGEGSYVGQQTVKLVGWGVDEDEGPFWIAINTFGAGWGVDGAFRIQQGRNAAMVETNAYGFLTHV